MAWAAILEFSLLQEFGINILIQVCMKLVIVESPAKAKTINKYLGSEYKVIASFGHIRDLDKKDFGVDIENNFKPNYIIL